MVCIDYNRGLKLEGRKACRACSACQLFGSMEGRSCLSLCAAV